ncbi:MAG: chemotaxis protein CheW [Angelakisella sp.]
MANTNLQTIAQGIGQSDTSEMDGKYLTFWTAKQLFGIPIADVVQIVGMQQVTEIPEFPYYAKGIINLRGTIIPLIDARLRLGKPEMEYNERTCIIVTNIEGRSIGFIVDEVDSVISIENEHIAPPPQMSGRGESYITGIGKLEDRVVLLMDTRRIVGGEELSMLTDVVV